MLTFVLIFIAGASTLLMGGFDSELLKIFSMILAVILGMVCLVKEMGKKHGSVFIGFMALIFVSTSAISVVTLQKYTYWGEQSLEFNDVMVKNEFAGTAPIWAGGFKQRPHKAETAFAAPVVSKNWNGKDEVKVFAVYYNYEEGKFEDENKKPSIKGLKMYSMNNNEFREAAWKSAEEFGYNIVQEPVLIMVVDDPEKVAWEELKKLAMMVASLMGVWVMFYFLASKFVELRGQSGS